MKQLLKTSTVFLAISSCIASASFAQSGSRSYGDTGASAYTDIVGQLEPSDTLEQFSAVQPTALSTAEFQDAVLFQATNHQGALTDWRTTEAGRLWTTDSRDNDDSSWLDGNMRLQIGIDYLYFSRGAASDTLAVNDANETFVIPGIDPGHDDTLRYRFLIATEGGTGFELTGYDFRDFSGRFRFEGEGDGTTPIFFGGISTEPTESFEMEYRSRLKNYEANVWGRNSERVKLGYGLRYINLDENFDIDFTGSANGGGTPAPATGGGGIGGFSSRTNNEIFGGQLMVQLYHPVVSGFYLTGGASGGYGNNHIEVDSDTANNDTHSEDDSGTGFFSFNGGISMRVANGLTVNAGYEGLLLTSVALAPDQSEAAVFAQGVPEMQTGALYFSGAYIGAVLAF